MRLQKIWRTFVFAAMLGSMVSLASSCKDDQTGDGPLQFGRVTGIATDDLNAPLADVTVEVSGMDGTVTTGGDGAYVFENVSVAKHIVTFSKPNFQEVSITLTPKSFSADLMASANPILEYAAAKISGTVLDAKNGNVPLEGVTVSVSSTKTTTTGADGTYLLEKLTLKDYTMSFSKKDYATVTKAVKRDAFDANFAATVSLSMGGAELFPGVTADDLKNADKWYYNEYRGGKGGGGLTDWSTVFMSTLDFRGGWENQNEGCALQIRNSADDQANPENLDMFDSYMVGSKKITEDNKIMTLYLRTHNASSEAPAYFGVQVVDLAAAEPKTEKIGGVKTHYTDSYNNYDFDLTPYIGKEVIVAVGIYRKATGDYWKQLPIKHISFASSKANNDDYLPGTGVVGLDGWHMTQEMVRSTMPHNLKSFTGITPSSVSVDGRGGKGYSGWRGTSHFGAEWSFMYVKKDIEPTAGEGFVIKTLNDAVADTKVPHSYLFAKFAIAAGSNQLTFKTRNFNANTPSYFKLVAITEDGVATALDPASNTATSAALLADGCWKFINNQGGPGAPDQYASFVYDLSQFNGQNVVIAIGVMKGEAVGGELKLCFYNVTIN